MKELLEVNGICVFESGDITQFSPKTKTLLKLLRPRKYLQESRSFCAVYLTYFCRSSLGIRCFNSRPFHPLLGIRNGAHSQQMVAPGIRQSLGRIGMFPGLQTP